MKEFKLKETADIMVCIMTAIVVLVAVLSGFYTVSEQEKAVVTRFGVPVQTKGPGPHLKIPFVENVEKVSTVSKGISLGYKETYGQGSVPVENESFMITKDFNFVNVDFYVEYRVTDPVKYLFESNNPEAILRNIVQAEVRTVVSEYNVDDVLTTAKSEIQAKIRDRVITDLDDIDIGLNLTNISMQDAEPPTQEVVTAFKNVENAKQQKETSINQATKEYNEAIPAARANADAILQDANGYKQSRVNEAHGQVARFNEVFAEYAKNKEITKTRLYLEAMEDILPGVKIIVSDGNSILPMFDLTKKEAVAK